MVAHRRGNKANPAVRQPPSDLPPERFARDHRDDHDESDEAEGDLQDDLRDLVETLERMARSDLRQRIEKCAADMSRHLADLRKSPPAPPANPAPATPPNPSR